MTETCRKSMCVLQKTVHVEGNLMYNVDTGVGE